MKKYYKVGSILIFMLIIVPYVLITIYGNFYYDDFTNYKTVSEIGTNSFVGGAFAAALKTYLEWQGTFSGNFFCFLFLKLCFELGHKMLVFVMAGIIISYFLSLCFLIYGFLRRVLVNVSLYIAVILFSIVLLLILFDINVDENFYWITAMSIYTLPLAFGYASIGVTLCGGGTDVHAAQFQHFWPLLLVAGHWI